MMQTVPRPMHKLLPSPRLFQPCGSRGRVRQAAAGAVAMLVALAAASSATGVAQAQLSFSSAVNLAVAGSPKVRMAQADLSKARAALKEARGAYAPVVELVGDLGYSYGAPIGEPTLFSFNAHSLAFNYSQHDYIRAASSAVASANLALEDARQQIAEDAAVTYLALDRDQQRHAALAEQYGYAGRLATIVQQRLDAGQDTETEMLKTQRTAAQIRLQMLLLDDEIDTYRTHLSLLDGLPDGPLTTDSSSIPALPDSVSAATPDATLTAQADTPGVAAAFASARAKRDQAFGDSRYMYRPQISFFAEYSRFSTFNNYQVYYPAFSNNTLNAIAIGIQISVPFYDRMHRARAEESSADAAHAEQEALGARNQMLEGRRKLRHAAAELAARVDVASIDQQLAQRQLDAVLIQLQVGTGSVAAPSLSPKDEQNARIEERQRFLDLLDARFQLQQAQIQYLRQVGELEDWLRSLAPSVKAPANAAPGSTVQRMQPTPLQ